MNSFRTALLGAALVAILAACSGGGAAASVTPPPDADVTIAAKDGKFDQASVTAPAGVAFELFFKNLDPAPHNVAIFTDSTASRSLYVGETISDGATTYQVPTLEPGTYFFRCDVHPNMTGSIVAES